MSSSPWIQLPSNDATHWPTYDQAVWIRMREWPRVPLKAFARKTDDGEDPHGGLWFDICDDDDASLNFGVNWPDIDAWQPRT